MRSKNPAVLLAVDLIVACGLVGCLRSPGAALSVAEQTKAILQEVKPASASDLQDIAAAMREQAEAQRAANAVMELAIKQRDPGSAQAPEPFRRSVQHRDPDPDQPPVRHREPEVKPDVDAAEAAPAMPAPSGDPVVAAIDALRDSFRAEQEATRKLLSERVAVPESQPRGPDRLRKVVAATGVYAEPGTESYTGCLFYTEDPTKTELGIGPCGPCNDLVRAIRKTPTTTAETWLVSTNRNAHFWLRELPAEEAEQGGPLLVFYRAGQPYSTLRGVPQDLPSFMARHPSLGSAPEMRPGFRGAAAGGPWPQAPPASSGNCASPSPYDGGRDQPWPQATAPTQRRLVCRGGRCWWE